MENNRGIGCLQSPRSVAVVGVSHDESKIGTRIFRNIQRNGFSGAVYPVSRNPFELDGHLTYRSLTAIDVPVDLVVICVPNTAVEAVIAEAVAMKAGGACVITSGFAEVGEQGGELERHIVSVARRGGLRLIGPNCFGVINGDPSVQLVATFGRAPLLNGTTAIATQSGACGILILEGLAAEGLGVGRFVSLGNSADLAAADFLEMWGEDPTIQVVVLYLEGLPDASRFIRAAQAVSARKPLFVMKGGRTSVGARGAASHTAVVATPSRGTSAVFERGGAVECASLSELIGATALAARWNGPPPLTSNVAVITNSGGPGILFADRGEPLGLLYPEPSPALQTSLQVLVSPQAGLTNPFDLTAAASPSDFVAVLERCAAEYAVLVVLLVDIGLFPFDAYFESLVRLDAMIKNRLLLVLPNAPREGCISDAVGSFPVFRDIDAAATALAAFLETRAYRERLSCQPSAVTVKPPRTLSALRTPAEERWLRWEEVVSVLRDFDLPCVEGKIVPIDDAVGAAGALGFPVVLKAHAPALIHKSDVGGVIPDIRDASMLAGAIERLKRITLESGRTIESVLVQPFVPEGLEGYIGFSRDRNLGPLLSCGWGGTTVEVHADIAVGVAPVTHRDAHRMVDTVKFARLLTSFRGRPPADRNAFEDAIVGLGQLAIARPEIVECDLNPVMVLPEGQGLRIVDGRMRLGIPR